MDGDSQTGSQTSSSLDDRERPSTASARRRDDFYSHQRHTPTSSTSTSAGTARLKSKGQSKNSYQEPGNYSNLDEQAVAPPVGESDSHRPDLEKNIGPQDRGATNRGARSRTGASGDNGLTEVAAPRPVDESTSGRDGQNRDDLEYRRNDRDGSDESENLPPSKSLQGSQNEVPRWLTEVYTVSYLVFFSLLGTLARLGVQWISFYPGAPVTTPVIWANFGGSLFMGFLAEDQGLFRNSRPASSIDGHAKSEKKEGQSQTKEEQAAAQKAEFAKHKKTIPLYIGLATGFCGSFTSFSSFVRDYFLALSNNLPSPIDHPYPPAYVSTPSSTVHRNGGYGFEAFLGVILQTLALSLGGLIIGAQIAVFLEPITPALPFGFVRKVLDRVIVFLGFGCWLGAVFLAIWPPDRPGGPSSRGSWINETWRGEVLFALVFAPLGCLLRFYASLKLNGLVPAFPLGTFAVNMLGTAIEGMCYDIQHVGVGVMGRVGGGRVGCQVLQGVMDGFCGCLTTVSTWVAEINGLKRKHGWLYAFGSLLGGLCLMVIIMGSVRWSVGFSSPVCDTGYPDKVNG